MKKLHDHYYMVLIETPIGQGTSVEIHERIIVNAKNEASIKRNIKKHLPMPQSYLSTIHELTVQDMEVMRQYLPVILL